MVMERKFKMLMNLKKYLVLIVLLSSSSLFGAALIAKHDGSAFKALPADKAKDACGSNFAFRDEHQKIVPPYLGPVLIKYTFTSGGKLHSSLDAAKKEASASGKCIWYVPSEKAALGL